jgi:SAM-dependent methyltransferase
MADIALQTSPAPASRKEDVLSAILPRVLQDDRLATIDAFPSYDRARQLLENLIVRLKPSRVADIGGGANPLIKPDFVAATGLRYDVLDISAEELAKAPDAYSKIVVDLCAPAEAFARKVEGGAYGLVFTHMFLEHIQNPQDVHRNIRWMLKPGGLAVHVFPSSANLPLTINRLLPEALARALLRIIQPKRDFEGHETKHAAYYKFCGAPSRSTRDAFDRYGFDVLRYKGFVGHAYYSRFPVLRHIEFLLRKPLAALGVPLVSGVLLIARRR